MATTVAREMKTNMADEQSSVESTSSRQSEEEQEVYVSRTRRTEPIPIKFHEIFFGKRHYRFWNIPRPAQTPQGVPAQASLSGSSISSTYMPAADQTQNYNNDSTWSNANSRAVQSIRIAQTQRSVMARQSSLQHHYGWWYFMAMVLPLFSLNTYPRWRCTPSLVINTMELLITHFSRFCLQARGHLRLLAQDRVARELFATAMDIVLVIYAIGFLVISMYQASVFG